MPDGDLSSRTSCPTRVGGDFHAGYNLITNLTGVPRWGEGRAGVIKVAAALIKHKLPLMAKL